MLVAAIAVLLPRQKPVDIIEKETVKALVDAGQVVITVAVVVFLLFVKVTICVVPARLSIKTGPAPV
ncbi:carbamate kinase [Escherichia coli]|uniref:Carbamate kinase n=1 Tax=Escherichia coli TaxID=562 RepID=A0A2X3JBA0_ECOLX|nr:carbamate kinase [Escherichia coli]